MYDNPDYARITRCLDAALLEQARLWQSFVSGYTARRTMCNVDWTEEFCLLVHNRLAKLRRQGVLLQICLPESRRRDVAREGLQEIEKAIDAIRMGRE
jgi:hypothetical protein